ncbi:MAG TPA: hypothetical protein VLF89_09155, partial [Candidatus Saccharimonadales bacterium]|nr:hypothetical protein [Candidatus Saccharimonadales bacterium]
MPEKVRIADIGVTALVEVNKKNSTIKAAATTYMKDAVTRVAGSLNPAAWSAMFSTAASKEFTRFTESSRNSPHATPL